tara:strand:- start:4373 stop:4600 length:228 start_codon:yes stop_codon:yes gene_type:complete
MNLTSYWDILPNEIIIIILEHKAALTIQNIAVKMFYKRYGKNWKEEIQNYEENLDYFCYLTGINDPSQDYINYFR